MRYYILFLVLFTACDFPEYYFEDAPDCKEESIFSALGNSRNAIYQKRALAELQNRKPSDFRYFFKTFIEEGTKTYMLTNFRNEQACFDVKVRVERWDKLAGMKRTNGRSYPNELYDLKWEIQIIDGQQEVIYLDMHRIID